MPNSLTEAIASSFAGVALFYLVQSIYYEIKTRLEWHQHEKYMEDLEDLEDEAWDK